MKKFIFTLFTVFSLAITLASATNIPALEQANYTVSPQYLDNHYQVIVANNHIDQHNVSMLQPVGIQTINVGTKSVPMFSNRHVR